MYTRKQLDKPPETGKVRLGASFYRSVLQKEKRILYGIPSFSIYLFIKALFLRTVWRNQVEINTKIFRFTVSRSCKNIKFLHSYCTEMDHIFSYRPSKSRVFSVAVLYKHIQNNLHYLYPYSKNVSYLFTITTLSVCHTPG